MKTHLKKKIVYLDPRELKAHPVNKKYFPGLGYEQKKLLIESIKKRGILHSIVITPDKTILSGHERWKIAKKLNLEKVPCVILDISSDSEQAESIIIETNLAQRIITPDIYKKCWESYENISGYDNFKNNLIPEFKKALIDGKINLAFIKAISKFSKDEQKEFLSLLNIQFNDTKIKTLKETLKLERKRIKEFNYEIELKDNEIKKLKENYNKIKKEQTKILKQKEQKEKELKKLMQNLEQRYKDITDIKNLEMSKNRTLNFKKEIEDLLNKLKVKDKELQQWMLKYQEIKENADKLYGLLQKERKEKQKLINNFEKQLNEKIEEIKKQEKQKKGKTQSFCFAPLISRFSVYLDFMIEALEEISGGCSELTIEQKKYLLNKMDVIKNLLDKTFDFLKGKQVNYSYEEEIYN